MGTGFRVSFYSRYQLERLLTDGAAKTFRAVENASGRPVLLHLFNPEGRSLFDSIAAGCRDSAGRPKSPLIETGEFAGSLYAVTEVIEPFTDLRAWAERFVPNLSPAPPAPVVPDQRSSKTEPGEFTRMFALEQSGVPPIEIAPAPPPKREMGAFTREFFVQAEAPAKSVESSREQQSAWPAQSPAPPQAPTQGPLDDFERVLGKPPAKADPQAANKPMWPESPRPTLSNDISDLFGSDLKGEHIDVEAEQARAAQSTPPGNKPFRHAGTFTRMFGPGGPRAKNDMPERNQTSDSFLLSTSGGPSSRKETTGLTKKATESKKEEGPGEYTRMFAVPHETEQPALPASALPPPAAPLPAAQSNRMMVIAFVLIGTLLIAVIILAALLYANR